MTISPAFQYCHTLVKTFSLALLILAPAQVFACGAEDGLHLGGYHRYGFEGLAGPAATISKKAISIDKTFVHELIARPSGKRYTRNKYELLYLISIGDPEALHAGAMVLLHLLKHPEYVVECDQKIQLYNVPELSFMLARSFDLVETLCLLQPNEWTALIKHYEHHPQFWGSGFDRPASSQGRKQWCEG